MSFLTKFIFFFLFTIGELIFASQADELLFTDDELSLFPNETVTVNFRVFVEEFIKQFGPLINRQKVSRSQNMSQPNETETVAPLELQPPTVQYQPEPSPPPIPNQLQNVTSPMTQLNQSQVPDTLMPYPPTGQLSPPQYHPNISHQSPHPTENQTNLSYQPPEFQYPTENQTNPSNQPPESPYPTENQTNTSYQPPQSQYPTENQINTSYQPPESPYPNIQPIQQPIEYPRFPNPIPNPPFQLYVPARSLVGPYYPPPPWISPLPLGPYPPLQQYTSPSPKEKDNSKSSENSSETEEDDDDIDISNYLNDKVKDRQLAFIKALSTLSTNRIDRHPYTLENDTKSETFGAALKKLMTISLDS